MGKVRPKIELLRNWRKVIRKGCFKYGLKKQMQCKRGIDRLKLKKLVSLRHGNQP